ncbi:MAG: RNase adapter RapZ, partial [Acidobacteria bacterium]
MASVKLQSLVIITGMSGSGKHTAFNAFEDLGYFCVDNLPTSLISRLIQMSDASGGELQELAIVIDVRLGEPLEGFEKLFGEIRQSHTHAKIIFVDASTEVLARRYGETRRLHPLAQDTTLLEGIRAERKRLASVRTLADLVIDTSDFSVHDLRDFIYQNFQRTDQKEVLNVSLVSFGFKNGIPHNSELVFDVRFLPNPYFVPALKEQTGNDP